MANKYLLTLTATGGTIPASGSSYYETGWVTYTISRTLSSLYTPTYDDGTEFLYWEDDSGNTYEEGDAVYVNTSHYDDIEYEEEFTGYVRNLHAVVQAPSMTVYKGDGLSTLKTMTNISISSSGTAFTTYAPFRLNSTYVTFSSGYTYPIEVYKDGEWYADHDEGDTFRLLFEAGVEYELSATRITYPVTYDGNAPEGQTVSNVPASQTKYHGTRLRLRTGSPTCTGGWTFDNWFASDGNYYNPGDYYTGNDSLTLWALWNAPPTPTTTYHLYLRNNNDTATYTDYMYTGTETSHTFNLSYTPTDIPSTKVWIGWNTSSGLSTALIAKYGSFTLSSSSPTLYIYAALEDKITPFYWDLNDGTLDSTIINTGLPISNITVLRWNTLIAKTKATYLKVMGTSISIPDVTSTSIITKGQFKLIRDAIQACITRKSYSINLTPLPATNDIMYAKYFRSIYSEGGTTYYSLLNALNYVISYLYT